MQTDTKTICQKHDKPTIMSRNRLSEISQISWFSLVRFASFHLMRPFLNGGSKILDKKQLGFVYFVA